MHFIGLDVHKRDTQICVLDDKGAVVAERRVRTESAKLGEVFSQFPTGKVLLEASTESEWVARCLEGMGREVIVADSNRAPMYATRSRKVKTDKRDARTLTEACRLGAYRQAYRMRDDQRSLRKLLDYRALLVRVRTMNVKAVRSGLRQQGLAVKACEAEDLVGHVEALELPKEEREVLTSVLTALKELNRQSERYDRTLKRLAAKDVRIRRLTSVPGGGLVTALSFVAVLGKTERFAGAHQAEAFVGLVPSEQSSGEKQHRGAITKAGNGYLRSLLVQCAWSVLTRARQGADELRAWAQQVALRRGKNVAVVALARRLVGILFTLWRDGTSFEPARVNGRRQAARA